MAQEVELSLVMLESHIVGPGSLILIQFPDNAPRKAAENEPSTWVLTSTCKNSMESGATGGATATPKRLTQWANLDLVEIAEVSLIKPLKRSLGSVCFQSRGRIQLFLIQVPS